MEIGANDGNYMSQSKVMVSVLGWRRILVEANPMLKAKLRKHSHHEPSFALIGAICGKEGTVHFTKNTGTQSTAVLGIAEFMLDDYIRQWHPHLWEVWPAYTAGNTSEEEVTRNRRTIPVPCLPLSKVMAAADVTTVDLFILDVEGGELSILESADWEKTAFNVLVIETKKSLRSPFYADNITEFLSLRGYAHMFDLGRNSWYARNQWLDDFTDNSGPRVASGNHDFMNDVFANATSFTGTGNSLDDNCFRGVNSALNVKICVDNLGKVITTSSGRTKTLGGHNHWNSTFTVNMGRVWRARKHNHHVTHLNV